MLLILRIISSFYCFFLVFKSLLFAVYTRKSDIFNYKDFFVKFFFFYDGSITLTLTQNKWNCFYLCISKWEKSVKSGNLLPLVDFSFNKRITLHGFSIYISLD